MKIGVVVGADEVTGGFEIDKGAELYKVGYGTRTAALERWAREGRFDVIKLCGRAAAALGISALTRAGAALAIELAGGASRVSVSLLKKADAVCVPSEDEPALLAAGLGSEKLVSSAPLLCGRAIELRSRGRGRSGALLCGSYGLGNSGDRLIARSIAAAVRRTDPAARLGLLTHSPDEAYEERMNAVYTYNIFALWRALRRSRVLLLGGGTLLTDNTSTRSLLYYLFVCRLARLAGTPVLPFCCGIGPFARKKNRGRAAAFLRRCDRAVFRDSVSLRTAISLGLKPSAAALGTDAALLADAPAQQKGDTLCLSVRPWPGSDGVRPALAAAAREICKKYGLSPVVCSMESPLDDGLSAALAEDLGAPLAFGPSAAASASLTIAMRLHALIVSASAGSPFVGLAYDPKVSAFAAECAGGASLPLPGLTAASIVAAADRVFGKKAVPNGLSLRRAAADAALRDCLAPRP